MYQFYCAPNTYAMGVHVLLEELRVEYQIHEVTLYTENQDADFIAASPHARVPALRHTHGTACESGAIALFLSDRHLDKGFGIAPDDPNRASFLQWMFYLSSTVQPEVMLQFHPENYFKDATRMQQLKVAAMQRLNGIWAVLDDAYRVGPWLFGNRPTAVDYCLGLPLLWPECFSSGISSFPNLQRLVETIKQREGYQRAIQWHHARRPEMQ